jgi:hypothetical protein
MQRLNERARSTKRQRRMSPGSRSYRSSSWVRVFEGPRNPLSVPVSPSAPRNAKITNLFDMDHFSVNLFTSLDNSRGFLTPQFGSGFEHNYSVERNCCVSAIESLDKCSRSTAWRCIGRRTQNVYPGNCGLFKGF